MKIKNKKAQIPEFLSDTTLLIFSVFLLVIFFLASSAFFGWSKDEVQKSSEKYNLESSGYISLNAFLQKPVNVDVGGQTQVMTIADLIRLSKIDSKYNAALDSEVHGFDSYYSYVFKTEIPGKESSFADAYEGFGEAGGSYYDFRESSAYFYIPSDKQIITMLKINEVKK